MIVDAGPLVAASRNDRRFWAFYKAARQRQLVLTTTDAVIAQVYRDPRQANLMRALKGMAVAAFGDGRTIGRVCALTATRDVVDASLAVLAQRRAEPLLTSDADDFRRLTNVLPALDVRQF